MLSLTFIFGFIIATLLGASFHLVFGGDARRLALFLLSSWVGFAIGQAVGIIFDIDTFNIGTIHMFSACLGSLLALIAIHVLIPSNITTRRNIRRRE